MTTASELESQLAEAQESYRLANARIIELLDEKIAWERSRAGLVAALEKARQALVGVVRYGRDVEFLNRALRETAGFEALGPEAKL